MRKQDNQEHMAGLAGPPVFLALVGLLGLGVWTRSAELLPGELWLAQQLSVRNEGVIGFVASGLDEGLNDWGATVAFAALLGPILVRWGFSAVAHYAIAGAGTTLLRVVDFVERPRPTADLSWGTYVKGYGGFPSGHVVYVTILAATVAVLARRHERSMLVRRAVVTLAAFVVLVVGPARLVTNDHWAADVVAGYLTAVVLLAICRWASSAVLAVLQLSPAWRQVAGPEPRAEEPRPAPVAQG